MSKLSLSALLLALPLLSLPAGAQTQALGYTTGEFVRNQGVAFTSNATQGLAIHLSKEKATLLKGTTLKGIRSAFGTSQISDFKIFVTKELGGTPLVEQSVSGASTRLRDFTFSSPVTIDGDELYIGYTFHLDNSDYSPLQFDKTADYGAGLVWAYADGQWTDVSQRGHGAPVIQLLVEGAGSFSDLAIKPFDAAQYYRAGKDFALSTQLFNFGTTTVENFEVTASIDGQAASTYTIDNVNIAPNTTYDFTIPDINPTSSGFRTVKLDITKVNAAVDAEASDNGTEARVCIYPEEMKRRFLLENFTGQQCSNCPRGHQEIQSVTSGREDDFVIVAHHSGYQPDFFTMTEDYDYTWFYGGSTYAPAAMLDRYPLSEDRTNPVLGSGSEGLATPLKSLIALRESTQPYVSVDLADTYDEATRKCAVTVTVHTYNVPSSEVHRLNLWLTQDSLIAAQTGAGSDYVHNHVFRGSLTGSWGEDIELKEGETITRTYEYTLPDEIFSTYEGVSESKRHIATDPARMHWVAFVGDATASTLSCTVWNANTLPVTQNGQTSAVATAHASAAQAHAIVSAGRIRVNGIYRAAQVYAPTGQHIATLTGEDALLLPAGCYLVAIDGGQAQKVLVR